MRKAQQDSRRQEATSHDRKNPTTQHHDPAYQSLPGVATFKRVTLFKLFIFHDRRFNSLNL
jgi:hypothetical protein